MPRHPAALSAAVVTVVAISAAACSDKPATGPVDASFVKQATAQCQSALEQVAPNPFPIPGFDALNPEVAQLPRVGYYFDHEDFNHKEAEFVKSFGTPHQGAKTWSTFVNLVVQQQAVVGKQITAAEASDKTGFVAAVKQSNEIAAQLDTAGLVVGFAKDSYCLQLFGTNS
jgi:hypothetical protein